MSKCSKFTLEWQTMWIEWNCIMEKIILLFQDTHVSQFPGQSAITYMANCFTGHSYHFISMNLEKKYFQRDQNWDYQIVYVKRKHSLRYWNNMRTFLNITMLEAVWAFSSAEQLIRTLCMCIRKKYTCMYSG